MRTRSNLSWLLATGAIGVACNAVLGLEQLEEKPPGAGDSGEAGQGTGGTSGSGKGGSSGGTSKGGSAGRGGSTAGGSAGTSGAAGESDGGMGGGGDDCTPGDDARCDAVDPTLVGNCGAGTVTCRANGSWGPCSVTPEDADSCDDVGDDADCDGTENGGCPCVTGDERECGPTTEEGICEDGTQSCVNEVWGPCEGAVFPEMRDCLSAEDNDCDGTPDNVRDAECPCAVDGAHVCVEDAPVDWEGPMALATGPGGSASPSCSSTGYDRQVLSLFGALNEGTTTCNCSCSTPTGTCGSSICVHRTSTSQQCQLAGNDIGDTCEHTVNVGSCFIASTSGYYKPMAPSFTATSACNVQRTANIGTPVWTRRMVACEANGTSAAGCSAQAQCMPELLNPLEAHCIYRTGEQSCPSGPYSEQTIYYESFSEGRSCTNCSCGTATGTCSGSLHFSYNNVVSCSGDTLLEAANFGGCVNIDGSYSSRATPTTPVPTGSCPPSGGALQGSVTKAGAVTVCCKP